MRSPVEIHVVCCDDCGLVAMNEIADMAKESAKDHHYQHGGTKPKIAVVRYLTAPPRGVY